MKSRSLLLLAAVSWLLSGCPSPRSGVSAPDVDAARPVDTSVEEDTAVARDTTRDTGASDTGSPDTTPRDTGADGGGDETGVPDSDPADTSPDTRPPRGTDAGEFWNTYYYLSDESAYSGADDTTLYDDQCQPIAQVPSDFADDACIEGSARLEDGTVINYDEPCSCGPCSFCWAEMNPQTHPWGMGSKGNALEPLRSWAVDTDILAHGTVVYVPKWDGIAIPKVGELGGFTHDGCFRADDVGGGIDGKHFDFFAGTPAMRQKLEQIYPTRTDFRVYTDSPRCRHLE